MKYFEDFVVGETFTTPGRTITDADVTDFAGVSGDFHSLHTDEEFAKLAQEILQNRKYAGKTILICWHHGTIPDLARALGAADSPGDWDHKAFDRVWQLRYDEKGNVTFVDRPQQLLPGDSKK